MEPEHAPCCGRGRLRRRVCAAPSETGAEQPGRRRGLVCRWLRVKHFEEALADNPNFFRCHKSFIINKQHVVDYIRSDGGYLQLRPKHIIPVSRNRVDELLQSMSHLM